MNTLLESFSSFWKRNPALFLGLSLLLGTAAAFKPHILLFVLFLVLCTTYLEKKTLFLALLLFIGAYIATPVRYPQLVLPEEKIPGRAFFHIDQVKLHSSPFHKSILYKGTLTRFEAHTGAVYRDLPCQLYLPLKGARAPANTDYAIEGSLCQKADQLFILKPDKKVAWEPISSSFNLSEWRFQAKMAVSKIVKKEIADTKARALLIALATGEIDERILTMEFGKVGVQHILAISGFHFALAALFLNFLFRLFFPYKTTAVLLILALSLYYLFLGNAPSIQRAYLAISLVAAGQLFSLRTSGLNALGVGLLFELLFDPLVVTQLGFQLSFLCTLGILLLYSPSHRAVAFLLPERSFSQLKSMRALDRHGYVLGTLLRRTLALNLAVHIISLPVLLHLFHKFPLLSIAYNLFFPACVSLSMLLLLTAFFFSWFPAVSHLLHALNNSWTSAVMNVTSNPPAFLDFSLRTNAIPFGIVLFSVAFCFFVGVFFYERELLEKKAL
ncbi:MAG: ComEC/Rec2 family competence protein [Candidatus Melainabacteria bacterium]|nr:ComEC/Rec2 family competence protein [Candidatus Melainabacteria bacterium]